MSSVEMFWRFGWGFVEGCLVIFPVMILSLPFFRLRMPINPLNY
jgi:hypothetical protein